MKFLGSRAFKAFSVDLADPGTKMAAWWQELPGGGASPQTQTPQFAQQEAQETSELGIETTRGAGVGGCSGMKHQSLEDSILSPGH